MMVKNENWGNWSILPPGAKKKTPRFKERTYEELDVEAKWMVDKLKNDQASKKYHVKGAGLCEGADWKDDQVISCINDSKSTSHSYCRIHSPLYPKDE